MDTENTIQIDDMPEDAAESIQEENAEKPQKQKKKRSAMAVFLNIVAVLNLLINFAGNGYSLYYQFYDYSRYTQNASLAEDDLAFKQLIFYNSSTVVNIGTGIAMSGMLFYMAYVVGDIYKKNNREEAEKKDL